jgi:hypothetical protein
VDHGAVTPFLRDLLESLGLRKRQTPAIGLRAHREVVVPLRSDAAYAFALDAFVRVVGANIYVDDPALLAIEAGFGTVNQERVRATFEDEGPEQTRVSIEAHYPAGVERPLRSAVVDALADALKSGVGH